MPQIPRPELGSVMTHVDGGQWMVTEANTAYDWDGTLEVGVTLRYMGQVEQRQSPKTPKKLPQPAPKLLVDAQNQH